MKEFFRNAVYTNSFPLIEQWFNALLSRHWLLIKRLFSIRVKTSGPDERIQILCIWENTQACHALAAIWGLFNVISKSDSLHFMSTWCAWQCDMLEIHSKMN